jgi:hypothetical protein
MDRIREWWLRQSLLRAIVTVGVITIYFAVPSRDFRKFLAGAFFASAGIQLYLSVVVVSVPIIGTSFVQTPELGAIISDLAKQSLSPAMIVDVGVGPAENHLPDEIIGQEIMRKAKLDFGGLVQLGQLFIR